MLKTFFSKVCAFWFLSSPTTKTPTSFSFNSSG